MAPYQLKINLVPTMSRTMYDSWVKIHISLGEPPEFPGSLSHPAWPSQEQEPLFLFGTKSSLSSNDTFVCRQGWSRGALLAFLGPMASWFAFEAFTLVGLTYRGIVELPGPSWLSWSHKAWLTATAISFAWALACFSILDSLFLLILISITKYPKCHLYELGQGDLWL